MRIKGKLIGTEVPITGSDSVNWIDITVPSSTSITSSSTTTDGVADTTGSSFAPITEDRASCSVIGDPPSYIIRRINKSVPHVLELLEFSTCGEFPKNGFRISFPVALSPFTFICNNDVDSGQGSPYLLYALTVSGVAFVFKLQKSSSYLSSSSPLVESEYVEFDIRAHLTHGVITSVAAVTDSFLVGTDTGSVICLKLGSLTPTSPGFIHELRDDAGIGRLWGFMSRCKTVGAVQDLVISEIFGRKLVFALHAEGILRVWDLTHHNKVMNHNVNVSLFAGALLERLWISEPDLERNIYTLAILCSNKSEVCREEILVFRVEFDLRDNVMLSAPHSLQSIALEGRCIDVHVSSNKLTILKDNGLVSYNLFPVNENVEEPQYYALQEEFVADQLYQGSEHFPKDLLWINYSILSSLKEKNAPSISSMFLRRLLQPGIFHGDVFRAVMLDYNRHLNDSEMRSLTIGGLKNEILSVTEQEVLNQTPLSTFYKWRTFCNRYFDYWCKNNAPLGLLQSNGAIVLIRKSSISLFRSMETIEKLVTGSDEVSDLVSLGLSSSDDGFRHEILLEVLGCINSISQQLGKAASAVFYEFLISTPTITSDDLLPSLLKILETGYSSSMAAVHVLDDRSDIAWEKELTDQKKLRKFSAVMLLSLQNLSSKAGKWEKVLEVIEGYIKFLVPPKAMQDFNSDVSMSINTCIIVHSTSQIASLMFESALDLLLLLSYIARLNGQINMSHDDVLRVQFELVPMVQEVISEWLIIHFLATTSTESPYVEDFSYQLSSLKIDGNADKRSWTDRHGKRDFTLAILLLLSSQSSSEGHSELSQGDLLDPEVTLSAVRKFISWIIWGKGDESSVFLSHTTELAMILIRHGQYNAAEVLIGIVESYACKEHTSRSLQDVKGEWCLLQHLLGCALLAQGRGLHGTMKEIKEGDAVRCFFRASSGEGASQALLKLSHETGVPLLEYSGGESPVVLKLQYYQWAMQMFEQYNVFEGACHFALAALEQVDEALHSKSDSGGREAFNESEIAIKGRLWANVFKFTLDLNHYYDAYCAIISNPDEESKHICLRRFIIVLYDRGVSKILCNGQLPFIGLTEKVERELSWKAERSDIMMKQNPYKLLYAFEMHRQNWQKAASYLYRFTYRLRKESNLKDVQKVPMVILERLNGLSAAINALHLVHPLYAWIDPRLEGSQLQNEYYPSKKAKTADQAITGYIQPLGSQSYVDIETLEKEFVLTSAEYLLHLANIKWSYSDVSKLPSELVDLLVQADLYDMSFTVLLKFFKGSDLKRELERVFRAMSLKCCPNAVGSPLTGSEGRLLLTSSMNETSLLGLSEMGSPPNHFKSNTHWENLELYLGKYKNYHGRLPVIVAETLLQTVSEIELPLWLVHMFKANKKERIFGGMTTGEESNAASLFQLYVSYGRYTEATNLLLDSMNAFSSVRATYRKRPCSSWFPYTLVESLWIKLEESIMSGHMVDQSKKLQSLLHGCLSSHLKQLKVDSEDAISLCRQAAAATAP